MRPPRLAVVTPGSFVIPSTRSSSVERVIEHTIPPVADPRRTRIYGIRGEGLPARGRLNRIPCIRYPRGKKYIPSVIRDLKRWSAQLADVHNRPFAAYRIKRACPHIPVILTLHSTTFMRPPYMIQGKESALLAPLDRIVVNSEYVKQVVISKAPQAADKIMINYPGVQLEHFRQRWTAEGEADRLARLYEAGWHNRRILLYVGRLVPGKGVHRLFEALPRIIAFCPDVLLLVVGSAFYGRRRSTSYTRVLEEQAAKVRDYVRFIPYTPHDQLAGWYQLADLVIVPSLRDEAFGLVNLEAMAAAVPVVAARTGGIPEVVKDGITGMLVSPERIEVELPEAIIRLLQEPMTRRRMGLAGLQEASGRFLWEHASKRWAEMIAQTARR
ncbi:glycosyltransferase family 4 protein [Paenibacillus sp. P96]|uniref:Glycosyltransferase family 4 protein n=1 Tax=Paenibacillus zeirhizosphaerae TaxID=2987519 RepID=A0ABT9FUR4_9BACL|nr:glycosyltransferase family 4 protein [Paenibacillus sp. P96]MDP4098478.1 glycosyltransferase family 4 protein [Paenibacillus sp. P96]